MTERRKMAKETKHKFWIVGGCALALLLVQIPLKILNSEVTVVSGDPSAKMWVNGELFLKGKDSRDLFPFAWSNLIEIENKRGREVRRIYPYRGSHDSVGISISKDQTTFYVTNKMITSSSGLEGARVR